MLMNYLYDHFLEQSQFAAAVKTTPEALTALIDAQVFPKHSYAIDSRGRSRSFVTDYTEVMTYHFHLRGHRDWYRDVVRLCLKTEAQAREYFFRRYQQAKRDFLSGSLGMELRMAAPDVLDRFDTEHDQATWQHFLNGVYGICTRDGHPETIFLKQIGVMFVEHITMTARPEDMTCDQLELLRRTVDFLDKVESSFAPHEVSLSSRQRCIADVRAKYFST